jgi:hypothetical protein
VQGPERVAKAGLRKSRIVAKVETPRRVERCRTPCPGGVHLLRGRGQGGGDDRHKCNENKAKQKHATPGEHGDDGIRVYDGKSRAQRK